MRISRHAEGWQDRLLLASYVCVGGLAAYMPGMRRALYRRALAWRRSVYGKGVGVMRLISVGDQYHVRLKVDISERTGGDLFFGLGFEPMEARLLAGLIVENDVVADVGANIGVHAMLCAYNAGSAGHVYAFEPGLRPYTMLQDNVALNGFSNVTTNKLALGETPGTAVLQTNSESSLNSLGRTGRGDVIGAEEVEVTTLDMYFDAQEVRTLDFIKIDVEGFEGHVLRGGRRILNESKDVGVLCELAEKNFVPLGYSIADVLAFIRQQGFDVWELDEVNHRIGRLSPKTQTRAQNFLFLRPGSGKERRLLEIVDAKGYLVGADRKRELWR